MAPRDDSRDDAASRRRRRRHDERDRSSAPPQTPAGPAWHPLAAVVPWLGPVAIAVVGAVLCDWTWRTWPDVLVDSGRELYLAWQLAQGKVLYADVVHFCGPLAPYWNALWFRLFGPAVLTLATSNLVLVALLIAMLHVVFARIASPLAATAAGLAFVTLFVFAQYARIGNYNWVCPYSHDLTFGVWLGIAGLAALARYQRHRDPLAMGVVGFVAGLLVLTKAETMMAGGLAITTGVVLTLWAERPDAGRLGRLLAIFAGAAALPLVVVAAAFAFALPLAEVVRWPLGHWLQASRPDLRALPMYRQGMGIDDVAGNLRLLATSAFWYAVVLVPAALVAVRLREPGVHRPIVAAGIGVATAAALWMWTRQASWGEAARPLPLFMVAIVLASLVDCARQRRRDTAAAFRAALRTAFGVLALAMLAKMLLNARLYNYGFALAMPATLVLVVALVAWVPAFLDVAGGYGPAFRAAVLGALGVAIVTHLGITAGLIAAKRHVVGEGADAIRADERGVLMGNLLTEVRARMGPDQTLVVIPDGIIVNYLARRPNPTPYYQSSAFCMTLWGEDAMLASLEQHPADYIAILNRDFTHEGGRFFGRDYGQRMYAWILQHYQSVWQAGVPLFTDQRLGVVLMRRLANDGP